MKRSTLGFLYMLFALAFAWNSVSVIAGESPQPGQAPDTAPQEKPPAPDPFAAEMDLASKSTDRDSRVEHLKKALELRPNDRRNISIEYQIGIELSQRCTPGHPEMVAKPLEALGYFVGILQKYNADDYYEFDPHAGAMGPQEMICHAAILASAEEFYEVGNVLTARQYAYIGMDIIHAVYLRRLNDWRNETAPQLLPPEQDYNGWSRKAYRRWEERQKLAAEHDVLRGNTFSERAAVEVFCRTFEPKNTEEMKKPLEIVSARYPDSPLSKAATEILRDAEQKEQQAANTGQESP